MRHKHSKVQRGLLLIEGWLDSIFTPGNNPFYCLGAIAVFFLWVLVATGVYLLIYYKISVEHAYESVRYLSEDQRYIGGIIRSIHRYSSDGLVIVAVLHLLRVYVTDRYRDWRWVAWVSGVSILVVIWLTGILGYWMVWDERAQLIAVLTAEMLDYFPIFTSMFTRAFLSNDTVTGLMFFIIIFLHVSVPVGLFFLIWIHVIRTSRPVINPPRMISVGIVIVLLSLALLKPALSTLPADLKRVPAEVPIDWFYLFIYPVFAATSPGAFWLIITLGIVLLVSVPWLKLKRGDRPEKAEIITPNCVGCEQCFHDCPYEAIYLKAEPSGPPGATPSMKADITPKRCASCGICVGSCDYGAVRLARWTDETVKKEVSRIMSLAPAGDAGGEGPRVFGFLCDQSVEAEAIVDTETMGLKATAGVKVMTLPCIGMLLPSFVEQALKSGADGVFICGCRTGDCYYREGNRWLEERFSGKRPPFLKNSTDLTRVRIYLLSALESRELLNEVRQFKEELASKGGGG